VYRLVLGPRGACQHDNGNAESSPSGHACSREVETKEVSDLEKVVDGSDAVNPKLRFSLILLYAFGVCLRVFSQMSRMWPLQA
jgi:hypothetical protein